MDEVPFTKLVGDPSSKLYITAGSQAMYKPGRPCNYGPFTFRGPQGGLFSTMISMCGLCQFGTSVKEIRVSDYASLLSKIIRKIVQSRFWLPTWPSDSINVCFALKGGGEVGAENAG